MKPFSIFFAIILIASCASTNGQNNQTDYLVVESNYTGRTEFEKSVKGSENIYFNRSEIPVLYQLDSLLEGKNVNNLHLYLSTKTGELDFGKFIITLENVADYSAQFKGLKQIVSGRVVIHSKLVFNDEKGKLFKEKLEEISGLSFETR
jgi:hypothetical protein